MSSKSEQCLFGPVDVRRSTRPVLPVLLSSSPRRALTPPHSFSVDIENAVGHGAIWDVYRCRHGRSGSVGIIEITSPSIYLADDTRTLPELLLDESSARLGLSGSVSTAKYAYLTT